MFANNNNSLNLLIMYDNLEEAITHKRFTSTPRPYPSIRFQDPTAVQPWEKNTLEIQVKQEISPRLVKTFYNVQMKRAEPKQYSTLRGFNFRKQNLSNTRFKPKTNEGLSRKSAISQYNINGNILGEGLKQDLISLPFQLPLKRAKTMRQKQKQFSYAIDYQQTTPARESVLAMKKRISMRKERNQGFLRLNSQNNEQSQKIEGGRKKSKVISLGFQKLAHAKGMRKQNSLQIGNRSFFI